MDKEFLINRTLNIIPLGYLRSVYQTFCIDILRNSKLTHLQILLKQLFQLSTFSKIKINNFTNYSKSTFSTFNFFKNQNKQFYKFF